MTFRPPKSPSRRQPRASPVPSQMASFCPTHSSCPQRPMPTVLLSRQGSPLSLPPNPASSRQPTRKVETPRREKGPTSAHSSSVCYWFIRFHVFFGVRLFLFLFSNGDSALYIFHIPSTFLSVNLRSIIANQSNHMSWFLSFFSFFPFAGIFWVQYKLSSVDSICPLS